jgi:hypothetical protein
VIGESRAAHETHTSIDDDDLAVSAIVYSRERVPFYGVIPGDLPARCEQFRKVILARGEAAYGIENQSNLNSLSRSFGHRFDESASDFALLKYVGFEVDAVSGGAYGFKLRFIEDLGVCEDFYAGVMIDLSIDERSQHTDEVIGAKSQGWGFRDFVSESRLEEREYEHKQKKSDGDDGDDDECR